VSTEIQTPRAAVFATTRWTLVLRARGTTPEAKTALSELCAAYWQPVFGFIRQTRREEDAARDLTQEFFARLLAHQGLDTIEPGRGRFRSFLLGAVKHFLADMRDRENAAKRGGGHPPVPLDTAAPAELDVPDPATPTADAVFDREWAVALVNHAVERLAAEHAVEARRLHFEVLKPWLLGDLGALTQSGAAERLGCTENAVRVAVHRLRRRFRELVKQEILHTVNDPAAVSEELRYLVEVLCHPPVAG
jgi:RNA polymerase sigma-70 factor (ECF subfamily)